MKTSPNINTVLFDLDETLFDHYYSMKSAITSVRETFPVLTDIDSAILIDLYQKSLQKAYDAYLIKEITYKEKDRQKVKYFFENFSLSIKDEEIDRFLSVYDKAYMGDRRATPGSVETLVRLREHGYKIGIVTNGQEEDQQLKLEAIGIHKLFDTLFTSQLVGYPKPSPEMFNIALSKLSASREETILVGNDIKSDIEGALDYGLKAVLYSPILKDSETLVRSVKVPIIHYMKELLKHLDIQELAFAPVVIPEKDYIAFTGIGIDIVTSPRHCMNISQETVEQLFYEISSCFDSLSDGNALHAVARVCNIMYAIAKEANLIDEEKINVIVPGLPKLLPIKKAAKKVEIETRNYSIAVKNFSSKIYLTNNENWHSDSQILESIILLFQEFLNKLMIDHPRAGIKRLRDIIFKIIKQSDIAIEGVMIYGENIEQA